MDSLGERIIRDRSEIEAKIKRAKECEAEARKLYAEIHEMERLLELAHLQL